MGNIAGIDYGMQCPAIAVFDYKTKSYYYHFYYGVQKHVGKKARNIFGVKAPEYTSPEERFNNLSVWALGVLRAHNVEYAGVEGVSYGSKGRIVELGENIGLLKHNLWKNNIEFKIFAPSTVHKNARNSLPEDRRRDYETGKLIKMDKERMVNLFFRETGTDLPRIFDLKADKNPLQDIADSYWILRSLMLEL